MFSRIKSNIVGIHHSLLPIELNDDKRKQILFYVAFYLIVLSTFLTVFSQLPPFTSRGLTQLFQIGWIITLIPLLMLDYKQILRYLAFSILLVLPFIIYCTICIPFKLNSFGYGATTYVFLCLYLFTIFGAFSKYRSKNSTSIICFSFLASAFFYALVVFLTKLRGQDISNQIYAFGDKNSAGPIFMSAAIIAFFLFGKRNVLYSILRWSIFAFFVFIIALSKTRSVLITIPIIFFIFLFKDIKNNTISFIALILFLSAIISVFAIPYFRETIIVNILLNGKTDIDSIFSGRLSQIVVNMQNFKPILGTGGSYFDCMVLSLLCSFGSIGFISILPFLLLPFVILFKYRKLCRDSRLNTTILALIILFLTSSLLEGFGYIGTGAKVFIFWFFVGNFSQPVFVQLKKRKTSSRARKVPNIVDIIPKNGIAYTISALLFICSIVLVSIPNFSFSIGKTVVDKLPSTNVVANYNEVKDIQINAPVYSMCVGQKITYTAIATPINAEDKSVHWSTGWIKNPCISVDGYTGEVTANRTGTALLHINRFRIGPNGVYIQYPVVSPENYIFDKTYISTNKFFKSFDHTENESIRLNKNCTQKVFYDSYYVPDESLISFGTSDSSVAVVENNKIVGVGAGDCIISASINGKEITQSLNHINVHVDDTIFNPVTSLEYNPLIEYYQYQKYMIIPEFNENASDKNYSLKVLGVKSDILGNSITFLENGNATVTIISDNEPTINTSFDVVIKENRPHHFECKTNRMKIGEVKTFEDLGISLVFSNGHKKIVDYTDILFDASDMTNRAWSNQNGFVRDRTTVKAVVTGKITIPLVSKLDNNVKDSFTIITSIYTLEEYKNISNGIGLIAISFVLSVAIIFSLFVPLKRRFIMQTLNCLATIIFVALAILLNGINVYFFISLGISILILLTTFIINAIFKTKIPLPFLEDPVSISLYIETSESQNKNEHFIVIDI